MSKTPQATSKTNMLSSALKQGFSAAKQNLIPGIFLWVFGIIVIVGYYNSSLVHNGLEQVGQWKKQSGWIFAAISTGLFGGLLPLLVPFVFRSANANRATKRLSWGLLTSSFLFWAMKGIEVDLFYIVQNYFFGSKIELVPIAIKTFIDQFVYCPVLGSLNIVVFYLWRDCEYSCSQFWDTLGENWYAKRVFPLLVSNWMIWIPAVTLIYCLPLALQLPVQNLILCFWVLVLTLFTSNPDDVQ